MMVLLVSVFVTVTKEPELGEYEAEMCRQSWQEMTVRAEMLVHSSLLASVSLAQTPLVSRTRRVRKMRGQERAAELGYCCPLRLVEQVAILIATAVIDD